MEKREYMTKKNGPKEYLSGLELYKEIIVSKAQGKLTPRAFSMISLMVKRINTKFRYKNEDDRQDVIQYSYYVVLKNWIHFDEEKYDNAFAFLTEVIKRAQAFQFNQLMKSQKKGNISLNSFYEDGSPLNL
jgi:hypothetical protein